MSDIYDRVRRILDKAQREDTPEDERDTAFALAAKIMAQYNIDAALLAEKASQHINPTSEIILVSNPFSVHKGSILHVISEAFNCKVIRHEMAAKNGGVGQYRIFGFPNEIESVKILFASALIQSDIGSERRRRQGNTSRGYHTSYMAGFAIGVRDQFNAVKQETESKTPGFAVVLHSRSKEIDKAVKEVYPKLTKIKRTVTNEEGFDTGKKDGRNADLHQRNKVSNNRNAIEG